ncbi:hypothetical protein [Asticcacaulis benevestitus]|uniref:Microcin J25-processing protein McjB C-terminal domain-containing protein n=1 Tax=Asticcacaulis benevestitus DSM 16100 = ATCC BAA-896 TaxID=1121022 RepID=V4R8Q2_9CAUL|nr:hypothetical protein [Asticcacaulis benevestitus]ESQ87813.1 hypothetical protein ABENE_16810 [Asticcacaulis benevestitus DSM 16100 = ATCC BAA-896]
MRNNVRLSKAQIDQSALALLTFLGQNRHDRTFEYPFGYSYPTNCCESVSLILTYLLEEKYNLKTVEIVKGKKRLKYEFHYWVRVGDLHYDLTAHQFPRRKPIIGALAHPLFFKFPDWEIEKGRDFVERDQVIEAYRHGVIPF